ncbi:MAG: lipase family protein [Casimicrobium sp.]|jgi:triacylglycerol lipase
MPTLSPVQAAKIANGVYSLRDVSVSQAAALGFELGCEGMFNVGDNSRFQGTSGGLIVWKEVSGFGYIASGTGRYQGEVLVAHRGTDVAADWCTDANFGVRGGPTGSSVHAGFMETWSSFSHELDTFLRGRNPSIVHCVGHSLGGALATLTAAYCRQRGIGQPELYTFGSPRVGLTRFAFDLSDRLGSSHIHRVQHFADPVPMVPLWPFTHVPYGSSGNVVGGSRNTVISFGAHSMENSYLGAMVGCSWATLAAASVDRTAGQRAEAWLRSVANGRESIVPMGAYAFEMLGAALRWIIDASTDILAATVGPAALAAMTLLDQLAVMLERAAQLTARMSMYVTTLVGAIMRFAGRAAAQGVELTRSFIRWALQLLFTPIRQMANAATRGLMR